MDSAQPAIEIKKLSKRYRGSSNFALKDLSLKVMPGEVYGFLGPNAAGKSTTIRTLMNFIQPTTGTAEILGQDIVADSVKLKRSIGYLSGDVALYPKATAQQLLDFLSQLTPGTNARSRHKELAKSFQAELNKPIGELSKGNRQKIGLIQAFMHEPAVLILDEPTSGLDPLMQEEFFKLVAEAKSRGAAIFLSSHNLAETQRICDRVGIIREGKLIAERKIADMASEAAQTFDIVFKDEPPLEQLKEIKGVSHVEHQGNTVTFHFHGPLAPLLAELARHDVVRLDTRTLDLEEVFLRFYKDEVGK